MGAEPAWVMLSLTLPEEDKVWLEGFCQGFFELCHQYGLQLVGVGDRDSIKPVKFQEILNNLKIDKIKPAILLKHQPSQLDIAEEAGISLQISGHTHKAQTFPLNIFTHFIFKGYDYGFHMYKNMAVYTSSGIGTWGPPLRVGSDGEIVVLHFTKN
jgi:predicted MPP superfamily phosphohydrolase